MNERTIVCRGWSTHVAASIQFRNFVASSQTVMAHFLYFFFVFHWSLPQSGEPCRVMLWKTDRWLTIFGLQHSMALCIYATLLRLRRMLQYLHSNWKRSLLKHFWWLLLHSPLLEHIWVCACACILSAFFLSFVVAFFMLCVCLGALLRLLLLLATTSLVIAAWLHFLEGRLKNVLFIFFSIFSLHCIRLNAVLQILPSAFFQYTYTLVCVFFFCIKWLLNAFSEWFLGSQL